MKFRPLVSSSSCVMDFRVLWNWGRECTVVLHGQATIVVKAEQNFNEFKEFVTSCTREFSVAEQRPAHLDRCAPKCWRKLKHCMSNLHAPGACMISQVLDLRVLCFRLGHAILTAAQLRSCNLATKMFVSLQGMATYTSESE